MGKEDALKAVKDHLNTLLIDGWDIVQPLEGKFAITDRGRPNAATCMYLCSDKEDGLIMVTLEVLDT